MYSFTSYFFEVKILQKEPTRWGISPTSAEGPRPKRERERERERKPLHTGSCRIEERVAIKHDKYSPFQHVD